MELISYDEFAALQLTGFADEDAEIAVDENVKHEDGMWITQHIPGGDAWDPTSFWWRKETPESLVSLTLAVPVSDLKTVQKVIARLKLPFKPGMKWPIIRSKLGEPYDVSSLWGRGGEIYTFKVGDKCPYRLDFYAQDKREPDGLIMKPWSRENL